MASYVDDQIESLEELSDFEGWEIQKVTDGIVDNVEIASVDEGLSDVILELIGKEDFFVDIRMRGHRAATFQFEEFEEAAEAVVIIADNPDELKEFRNSSNMSFKEYLRMVS